jgi:hypothetical protein
MLPWITPGLALSRAASLVSRRYLKDMEGADIAFRGDGVGWTCYARFGGAF